MVGSSELVVILVLALLLFGPKKLPELARAVGKAMGEYNRALKEFEEETTKARAAVEDEIKEAKKLGALEEAQESRKQSAEIRKIARAMGITTEGKDDATLLKEIDTKVAKKPTQPVAQPAAPLQKPVSAPKAQPPAVVKPKGEEKESSSAGKTATSAAPN